MKSTPSYWYMSSFAYHCWRKRGRMEEQAKDMREPKRKAAKGMRTFKSIFKVSTDSCAFQIARLNDKSPGPPEQFLYWRRSFQLLGDNCAWAEFSVYFFHPFFLFLKTKQNKTILWVKNLGNKPFTWDQFRWDSKQIIQKTKNYEN